MGIHRYSGRVVEKSDGSGVAALRVEARDVERRVLQPVLSAQTDARGDFTLEVADELLESLFGAAAPYLYFQVVSGTSVLASTERTHRWLAARDGSGRIDVISDRPIGTLAKPLEGIVEGVVGTRTGSTLAAGLTVTANKIVLLPSGATRKSLLGSSSVRADGGYRITYPWVSDATAKPDLLVEALSGATLVASNTLCSAPLRAVVDVVIGGAQGARHPGVPRFSEAKTKVERVLAEGPTPLSSVQPASYAYVSCRAGVAQGDVQALVEAAQLNATHTVVPQEIFYAILAAGIPKEEIFTHRLASLRAILLDAADQRRVAPDVEDEITARLNELEAAAKIELSVDGAVGTREFTPIGQLAMLTPGMDRTKRDAFIGWQLNNTGTSEDFWAAVLRDDENFTGPLVLSLKFSADVAALVQSWPAMIAKMHNERTALVVSTGRDLAKYSDAQWTTFISATGFPPSAGSAASYKTAIMAEVERRYRTAFIGARQTGDLLTFFNNAANASFDFETKRVGKHVLDVTNALSGIAVGNQAAAVAGLKKLERLYRVTKNFDEMQKLITATGGAVYDSAYAIHKAGSDGLLATTTLTTAQIDSVLSKACWVAWGAMAMHAKHSPKFESIVLSTKALANKAVSSASLSTTAVADWTTLFGTLDQCACEHCRSVLSPSAYLVDLLEFLGRVKSGATNAKAKLFERRPDLQRLMLSCENANTALPYVDLVNEILEVLVATLPAAWPTSPATIDVQRTTPELLAHPELFYLPEYIGAYRKLAEGLHPFSLPFHLWAADARVYLNHLGVPRRLLIEKLAPPAGPDARSLAIERLDIAPKAYDLFAGSISPAPQPYEYWGFASPGTGWDTTLRDAPEFLRRSGLSYDELRELLTTESTYVAGVGLTDTCVLADLDLDAQATTAWFGETHKLLRLSRALGWSLTATAKAKQALGADWAIVTRSVAAIKLLSERTGVDPIELLGWFGDLDRWPLPTFAPVAGYRPEPSHFEEAFLSKAVLNPDEAALSQIWANRRTAGTLGERSAGLLPALEISQSDLDVLTSAAVSSAQLALPPIAGSGATLSNVSRVFRFVSAARAVQLRPADFVALHALAQRRAFVYAMPGEVHLWRGDDMATSGSNVTELFDQTGGLALLPPATKPTTATLGGRPAWKLIANTRLSADLAASEDLSNGAILVVIDDHSGVALQCLVAMGLASSVSVGENALFTNGASLIGRRRNDTAGDVNGSPGVADSSPHAILFTWDATATGATIYLDGALIGTSSVAATASTVKRFVLGDWADLLGTRTATNVIMAECRIGSQRLTAQQIAEAFDYTTNRYFTANPAIDARVEETAALLDVADKVRATGASMDEIHYVSRHVAPASSGIEPSAEVKAQWITEIEAAIAEIEGEVAALEDPSGEMVVSLATSLFTTATANDVQRLANDDATLNDAARNALIDGALERYLESTTLAKAALVGALPNITAVGERRRYLAQRLYRFVTIAGFVKSWAAATFGIPQDLASRLLHDGPGLSWQTLPAIFAFTRQAAWADTPKPADTDRIDILIRLHKASVLAKRFGWTGRDAKALFPVTGTLPSIDLDGLPLVRPVAAGAVELGAAQVRFATWLRLADLARLRDAWAAGEEAFFAFLSRANGSPAPTLAELDALVVSGMGWSLEDVVLLRARFGVTTIAGYQNETALVRMLDAMKLVQRLGTSATRALAWVDPTNIYTAPSAGSNLEAPVGNSYVVAAEIKRAAKAKHDPEAWGEIARPLRDVLRERQRSTLVDSLIMSNPAWKSPTDVYEHVLVDVEMSPCQLTSRIVLAHSTAQLFMHRVLQNLEPSIAANEDRAREWRWMKNYRVWEANRKVFLWPENWIEPELRDDKTPLFKELETKLLQGPIDHARAEDAFRAYLDGLADIGNLEIVAVHEEDQHPELHVVPYQVNDLMYFDHEDRIVHVFAKSRTANKYFYRKRDRGNWTPWEKLDADVDGQHLVPITIGRRLYLFWPQWTTRPADVVPSLDAQQPEQLGLRLGFSEHRQSGWTPPVYPRLEAALGGRASDFLWLGGKPEARHFAFTAGVDGETIVVDCNANSGPTQRIARFIFEVGTGRMSGIRKVRLVPGQVAPVPDPNEPQNVVSVSIPFPANPHFQTFRYAGLYPKPFRPWMLFPDSEPGPYTVFAENFDEYSVLSERKAEEYMVRTPLFFESDRRTLLLDHKRKAFLQINAAASLKGKWSLPFSVESIVDYYYRAQIFYHPFVASFRKAIAIRGLDGLLRWADQNPKLQSQKTTIQGEYDPTVGTIELPFPKETVDFTLAGAYSAYNWELFFHAPLLIATRLMQEGRHDEAMRWFHYIFDPTDGAAEPAPKRYWKFRPFRENDDLAAIQEDLVALSLGQYTEEMAAWAQGQIATPASENLALQIAALIEDPFDPHAIARLRVSAYQKAVVIKYIENLLAWGDQLFLQDTIESINEATQLYILAQEILGKRPSFIQDPTPVAPKAYSQLGAIDLFSNAIVEIEAIVPKKGTPGTTGCLTGQVPPELIWGTLYFCVPPNEKLLGLWDVIGDRLFKIRHCMNIEGVTRQLPLFEPPIDPALLVKATAAGIDIASVLNDINVAAPPYRYSVLYGKAQEFAASVVSLGSTLLSVLEKKDAEQLSNMRTRHEVAINELMRETRKTQVVEAKQNLKTLQQTLRSAEERVAYFGSRKKIYPGEQDALDRQDDAHIATMVSEGLRVGAAIAHIVPNAIAGFPAALTMHGGSFVGSSMEADAGVASMVANEYTYQASIIDRTESYKRRKEDWDHQARLAKIEVEQINRETLAAQIRLELAEKELVTVEKQIEQSREVETFLRRKFTNEELYGWMQGQLAGVYYQAYKLAYEMAKRAQKAFQYERGDATQTFISFGYWEGVRQGLLAGEKLSHDLRRMDAAYLAQNKRELELVKMVSLAEHAPDELVKLRDDGVADITLSEDDYDRDFPNHHLRRFKSITATVPCTLGPYQGVFGTLDVFRGGARPTATTGGTINETKLALQSIATSQAQQDGGLFELVFRDDRLLPFEGMGAHVGGAGGTGPQMRFSLSKTNRLDFNSVDDLVLDVRYTARLGRSNPPANDHERTLRRLVRVPSDFAEEWAGLKDASSSAIALSLPAARWPRGAKELLNQVGTVTRVTIHSWWSSSVTVPNIALAWPGGSEASSAQGAAIATLGGRTRSTWTRSSVGYTFPAAPDSATWTITFAGPPSQAVRDALAELWVIFEYTVKLQVP